MSELNQLKKLLGDIEKRKIQNALSTRQKEAHQRNSPLFVAQNMTSLPQNHQQQEQVNHNSQNAQAQQLPQINAEQLKQSIGELGKLHDWYIDTSDMNAVGKGIELLTRPLRKLADTKPGRALQNVSLGAAKHVMGDPNYGDEYTPSTGSERADRLLQATGQVVGPAVMMGLHSGPIGESIGHTVAANPALHRVSPTVLSTLRGIGTGLSSTATRDALSEEFNPTWKDYAASAAYTGVAGPVTGKVGETLRRAFPGIHPLLQAPISGFAGGAAGSAASLPFKEVKDFKDAAKQVGVDGATYALFNTLFAVPKAFEDPKDDFARAFNRMNQHGMRYKRAVENPGSDFVERSESALNDYKKATKDAYHYLKRSGADISEKDFLNLAYGALFGYEAPEAIGASGGGTGAEVAGALASAKPTTPEATPPQISGQAPVTPDIGSDKSSLAGTARGFIDSFKAFQAAEAQNEQASAFESFFALGQQLKNSLSEYGSIGKHPEGIEMVNAMQEMGITPRELTEILNAHTEAERDLEQTETSGPQDTTQVPREQPQYDEIPSIQEGDKALDLPSDDVQTKPQGMGLQKTSADRLDVGDLVYDPHGKEFKVIGKNPNSVIVENNQGDRTALSNLALWARPEQQVETPEVEMQPEGKAEIAPPEQQMLQSLEQIEGADELIPEPKFQAPESADFSKESEIQVLGNLEDESALDNLVKLIQNQDEAVALRGIYKEEHGERYPRNSYEWTDEDGGISRDSIVGESKKGREMLGTSAIEISQYPPYDSPEDLKKKLLEAFKLAENYGDGEVALIKGNPEHGEAWADPGEIVLSNAEVLGYVRKSTDDPDTGSVLDDSEKFETVITDKAEAPELTETIDDTTKLEEKASVEVPSITQERFNSLPEYLKQATKQLSTDDPKGNVGKVFLDNMNTEKVVVGVNEKGEYGVLNYQYPPTYAGENKPTLTFWPEETLNLYKPTFEKSIDSIHREVLVQNQQRTEQLQKEEDYNRDWGYTEQMTGYQRGRILKTLNKVQNYKGKGSMMRKDFLHEVLQEEGYSLEEGKANSKDYRLNTPDGTFYNITKTEYDFGKHLLVNEFKKGQSTELHGTTKESLVQKYDLGPIIEKAKSEKTTPALAQFLDALETVDSLSEEHDFGIELNNEITKLFSDEPKQSRFHNKKPEEITEWLNRYVRLANVITDEGLDITPLEAQEATEREHKINLQLFASKGGDNLDEWEQIFETFDSGREGSGSPSTFEEDGQRGLAPTEDAKAPSQRTIENQEPSREGSFNAYESEPERKAKPTSELKNLAKTAKDLKEKLDTSLKQELSGNSSEADFGEPPPDVDDDSRYIEPYSVRTSESAGALAVEHRRIWEGKNLPKLPKKFRTSEDEDVPKWVDERNIRAKRIWEGLPKQKSKMPYSDKEIRFVETPGLKEDVKMLQKPVKITHWATGLPTYDLVGNTVAILGARAKTIYNAATTSMRNEIERRREDWTPEQEDEANKILEGKLPLTDEMEKAVTFIRQTFDEYRKTFGIEGYIPNYLPHKAGDNLDDLLRQQDEILAERVKEIPGAVDYFARHRRTNPNGQLMFEDPFDALAYWFYRGMKATATDDTLTAIKVAKEVAHPSRHKFLDEYGRIVLGLPGAEETFINNAIAQVVEFVSGEKYTGRHAQKIVNQISSAWYDSNLMGNLALPIKNLGQQVLPMAMLSDGVNPLKGIGYWAKGVRLYNTKKGKELLKYSEILNDRQFLASIDRNVKTEKTLTKHYEPLAKLLWKPYTWSDHVNVSVSYLGGVYKALERNYSLEEAIRFGDMIAANTQYTYGTNGLMMFRGPFGRMVGMVNSWPLYWMRLNMAMLEGVGNLPGDVRRDMGKVLENLGENLVKMDKEFKKLDSGFTSEGKSHDLDFGFFDVRDLLAEDDMVSIGKGDYKLSKRGIARVVSMWIGMYLFAAAREKILKVKGDDTTPKSTLKGYLPYKALTSKDVSPMHTVVKGLFKVGESDSLEDLGKNTEKWLLATADSFIPAKRLRHQTQDLIKSVMNEYWKEDGIHNQMYQTTLGEELRGYVGYPVEREERKKLTRTVQNVYRDHFKVRAGKKTSLSSFQKDLNKELGRLKELGYTDEGIQKMARSAQMGLRTSAYNNLWKHLEAGNEKKALEAAMLLVGTETTVKGIESSFKSRGLPNELLRKAINLYNQAKRNISR